MVKLESSTPEPKGHRRGCIKGDMGDQAKGRMPHTQGQPIRDCADSWKGADFCELVHR